MAKRQIIRQIGSNFFEKNDAITKIAIVYQRDTAETRIGKQVVELLIRSNRLQADEKGTAVSGELSRQQAVCVLPDSLSGF